MPGEGPLPCEGIGGATGLCREGYILLQPLKFMILH
jgi:hypothetical protein